MIRYVLGVILAVICNTVTAEDFEFTIPNSVVDKIYKNETGGKTDNLIYVNPKEGFCSIGIGHFLWFPQGVKPTFKETFPDLLREMQLNGVFTKDVDAVIPSECPWKSQEEIKNSKNDPVYRKLFSGLISDEGKKIQVEFMAARAKEALEETIAEDPTTELVIAELLNTENGVYAIIDYVNFKGNSAPAENYNGVSWGLKTVIGIMPTDESIPLLKRFMIAAETALELRVEQASKLGKDESAFLDGWKKRIKTYGE